MAKKQPLLWDPASHLNSAHALRHAAPQLVGRLPRERANGFLAAAKMAHRQAMKPLHVPKVKSPFAPQAVKPPSFMAKPPAPVVPRMPGGLALNNGPPAGSALPKLMSGGLTAKPPIATPLNTSLPGLPPKLP